MRRIELIEAANQISQALTASKIPEVLAKLSNEDQEKGATGASISDLLNALKEYSIRAQSFTDGAKKVARILDLTFLEDAHFWSRLISRVSRTKVLGAIIDAVDFAVKYLPKIVKLVQQEPLRLFQQAEDLRYKGKSLLSVIVIEEENRFSSPTRLVEVLESVSTLYEACAIMMGLSSEALSVVACDSGSDKSFDFLGAAKIIECVKEVILSLWDRIVFFREKQLSQRIELIAEALPIIDQISNLERENKLGPEQAEILRRKILEGVGKFIACGAIIPEIGERSHFNPRALMAPEPKLLASASVDVIPEDEMSQADLEDQTKTEDSNFQDADISNLDKTERIELLRLLRKTKLKEDINSSKSTNESEDWPDDNSTS